MNYLVNQINSFETGYSPKPNLSSMFSAIISYKACGLYGIPGIVQMKFARDLVPVFSKLYNKFLDAPCFLACWKSLILMNPLITEIIDSLVL